MAAGIHEAAVCSRQTDGTGRDAIRSGLRLLGRELGFVGPRVGDPRRWPLAAGASKTRVLAIVVLVDVFRGVLRFGGGSSGPHAPSTSASTSATASAARGSARSSSGSAGASARTKHPAVRVAVFAAATRGVIVVVERPGPTSTSRGAARASSAATAHLVRAVPLERRLRPGRRSSGRGQGAQPSLGRTEPGLEGVLERWQRAVLQLPSRGGIGRGVRGRSARCVGTAMHVEVEFGIVVRVEQQLLVAVAGEPHRLVVVVVFVANAVQTTAAGDVAGGRMPDRIVVVVVVVIVVFVAFARIRRRFGSGLSREPLRRSWVAIAFWRRAGLPSELGGRLPLDSSCVRSR